MLRFSSSSRVLFLRMTLQLVGKAKAAARAAAKSKTAPKSSGVKNAWKFFKDVVAIELHPGYSDDTVTKIKYKPNDGAT